MQVILKDCIRFAVCAGGSTPAELEIHVRQNRFGGWEATALVQEQGAPSPALLGRVFRSRDRRLATGKMVAWVRRHYRHAQPLAQRRCEVPLVRRGR